MGTSTWARQGGSLPRAGGVGRSPMRTQDPDLGLSGLCGNECMAGRTQLEVIPHCSLRQPCPLPSGKWSEAQPLLATSPQWVEGIPGGT